MPDSATRATPAQTPASSYTGILLGLSAPLLWSSSGMFVKILAIPAVPLAGLRAVIAGIALAPFIRWREVRLTWALAALVAAYTVSVLGFVSSVKLTTGANAIALVSTAPAWVMVLQWAAARRIEWQLAWPVVIILAGVGTILLEPSIGRSLEGNLFAAVAGIGFGVFTFTLPRVQLSGPGLVSLCNLAAAALIFAVDPRAFWLPPLAAWEWASLLYLGAIQIGLATVCFAWAVRRIPAMQASILALLEPLLSPIWVYLAIGEVPSAYGWVGFVCILGGIVCDQVLRMRRTPAA